MTRTLAPRFFLTAALSTSLFAAACGGDDHSTAKFTGADAAHLDRALSAIAGGDLGSVVLVGAFVAGTTQPGCPAFAYANNVTTVSGGGCVNEDGVKLEGKFVITNMQGLFQEVPEYDPTKPSVVEAQDWKATAPDGTYDSIDGKVTMTPAAGAGGAITGAVEARIDGIDTHTDAGWSCDATDLCSYAEDSWIDVDGIGAATLSGQFRFDDPRTGAITATGAEILTLDVAASTDECRAYRIGDGALQMRCEPTDGNAKRAGQGNVWLRQLGK
jgi:hypothetical protein